MHHENRMASLDAAKGVGIIFVFIGHLFVYGSTGFAYIFSFHMPLFFLLSGVVFRTDNIPDFRTLIKKIYNGIILPGIVFNIIGIALFAIRLEWPFPDSLDYHQWTRLYISIVNECSVGGVAAWFLIALAGAKIAYWLLGRHTRPWQLWAILLAGFFIENELGRLSLAAKCALPLKLLSIPMATFYLAIGNKLRLHILQFETSICKSRWATLGMAISCFVIVWLCQTGETPNLAVPEYVNPGFLLVASLIGVAGVLLLSKAIQCRPICFIGRYSLYFFMLEGHVRAFLLKGLELIAPSLTFNPMRTEIPWMVIAALLIVHLIVQAIFIPPLERIMSIAKKRYSR